MTPAGTPRGSVSWLLVVPILREVLVSVRLRIAPLPCRAVLQSFRLVIWQATLLASSLLVAPVDLRAQQAVRADSLLPVRSVSPVEARTAAGMTRIGQVQVLSDGRVVVHDPGSRTIRRWSADLQQFETLADSLSSAIPYGPRALGLLPGRGDSTIVVEPATLALLVLSPSGAIARIQAAPRPAETGLLAGLTLGTYAFDPQGRLVYQRATQGTGFGGGAGGGGGRGFGAGGAGAIGGGGAIGAAGAPPTPPPTAAGARVSGGPPGAVGDPLESNRPVAAQGPPLPGSRPPRSGLGLADSAPILRADFTSRRVDTVTFVRMPPTLVSTTPGPGGMEVVARINPLPQGDAWALLADGTVAVVRVLDYRVELYHPDGRITRGAALPFAWKRLEDADKAALLDSLTPMLEMANTRLAAQGGGGGGGRGGAGGRFRLELVSPQDLPDYYPPVQAGTVIADPAGRLWVPPSTALPPLGLPGALGGARGGLGGAAAAPRRDTTARAARPAPTMPAGPGIRYDVIDGTGQLVERVNLPAGRQLVAIGPDGALYLRATQAGETFIERVRVMR